MISRVTEYATRVVEGEEVACELARRACRRHLLDLERPEFFYDIETEIEVLEFAGMFVHYQGPCAGRPFEPDDFQAFILCSILCWFQRADGLRRYRYAYVEIPRKNAKTFLAAIVAGYLMSLDGESGAEVYACATKKAQAEKVWGDFYKMVKRSPLLSSKFSKHWDHIAFPPLDSKFEPLSSSSEKLDGLNPHAVINDELHAWPSRDLYDVIEDGMGSREQPLIFNITTAGDNVDGICYEQRTHCVNVLENIETPEDYDDDTYFAFIATVDEDIQDEADYWKREEVWKMSNPALGTAKLLSYMRTQAKKVEQMPGKLNTFLRKQLNVWVTGVNRWIDVKRWKKKINVTFDEAPLEGLFCHGGLDLAATTDVAGYCLLFPPQEGLEKMTLLFRLFVPEKTIENRYKTDRVPYPKWAKAGHLIPCGEWAINNDKMFDSIYADAERFEIRTFGFDPWNANDLVRKLLANSFDMVRMRQGFPTLAAPTKEFETRVVTGEMASLKNPVIDWMIRNAVCKEDENGNKRPDKAKSREKIDGVIMAVMALGRYLATIEDDEDDEIYGDDDLLIL